MLKDFVKIEDVHGLSSKVMDLFQTQPSASLIFDLTFLEPMRKSLINGDD